MNREFDAAGDVPTAQYANYFEIGFNAFEFVLDFAQRYGEGEARGHTRIVTGPEYAKALYVILGQALTRFERSYGAIADEPDGVDDRS